MVSISDSLTHCQSWKELQFLKRRATSRAVVEEVVPCRALGVPPQPKCRRDNHRWIQSRFDRKAHAKQIPYIYTKNIVDIK